MTDSLTILMGDCKLTPRDGQRVVKFSGVDVAESVVKNTEYSVRSSLGHFAEQIRKLIATSLATGGLKVHSL